MKKAITFVMSVCLMTIIFDYLLFEQTLVHYLASSIFEPINEVSRTHSK